MEKVILQGYIEVPESELESVLAALPRHIELTRSEPGCLVFNVERDPVIDNRFRVYEEFVSQEAFDQHQARTSESHWGAVTRNVTRHYTIKRAPA